MVLCFALVCPLLLLLIIQEYYGVNLIFVAELIGSIMFADLSDPVAMVDLGEKIYLVLLVCTVVLFEDVGV